MKRYRTVASYAGAIGFEITAENEDEARTKADETLERMNEQDFLDNLDPQLVDIEVEEIE